MRIDVPWGTGTARVELESGRVAGVLGANVGTGGGSGRDTESGDRAA